MQKSGMIDFKANNQNFYVFKYSIFELADSIANWAKNLSKHNTVETVKWIIDGDETSSKES